MSVRSVLNESLTKKTASTASSALVNNWYRNPSWVTLSDVTVSDQKLVGIYAVFPDANFVALSAAGDYTVNWGDGTTENFSSGATAYHEYSFSSGSLAGTNASVTFVDSGDYVSRTSHAYTNGMTISFSDITTTTGINVGQVYYVINATTNNFQLSLTKNGNVLPLSGNGSGTILPYKQAIITLTPQVGSNLTSINLNLKHNQSNLKTYSTGWLDIKAASSHLTSFTCSESTQNVYHNQLEQVSIPTLGSVSDMSDKFFNCTALKKVYIGLCNSVTDLTNLFKNCYSLESVVIDDTSNTNNVNLTSIFYNCHQLKSVFMPLSSNSTNCSYMLYNCYSIKSIYLNTSALNNASHMFDGCKSLENVKSLNSSTASNLSYMFANCSSLKDISQLDTSSATNTSYMFSGCVSLTTIPYINTSSVSNMSSMFKDCTSLLYIPHIDMSVVTNTSDMFNGCYSLATIPLLSTTNLTYASSMFADCYSLITIPAIDLSNAIDVSSMFSGCRSLQNIPELDFSSVSSSANFTSLFNNCTSLSKVSAIGFNYSFSLINCKLSSARLEEIFGNLPSTVGQTITTTGNYGSSSATTSIATNKGWTVTS